jgi:LysM repeat protein
MPKSRRVRPQGDTRPDSYVVQRGDTLFGIALDFGLDYRELAAWNSIADPSRIFAGHRWVTARSMSLQHRRAVHRNPAP